MYNLTYQPPYCEQLPSQLKTPEQMKYPQRTNFQSGYDKIHLSDQKNFLNEKSQEKIRYNSSFCEVNQFVEQPTSKKSYQNRTYSEFNKQNNQYQYQEDPNHTDQTPSFPSLNQKRFNLSPVQQQQQVYIQPHEYERPVINPSQNLCTMDQDELDDNKKALGRLIYNTPNKTVRKSPNKVVTFNKVDNHQYRQHFGCEHCIQKKLEIQTNKLKVELEKSRKQNVYLKKELIQLFEVRKKENQKYETEILDLKNRFKQFAQKQQERQEQMRQEQEQTRQEQIRHEQLRHEQTRQDKTRQEQIRQEQIRHEQIRQEQIRQEQIRQDQIRQDEIRQEQIRKQGQTIQELPRQQQINLPQVQKTVSVREQQEFNQNELLAKRVEQMKYELQKKDDHINVLHKNLGFANNEFEKSRKLIAENHNLYQQLSETNNQLLTKEEIIDKQEQELSILRKQVDQHEQNMNQITEQIKDYKDKDVEFQKMQKQFEEKLMEIQNLKIEYENLIQEQDNIRDDYDSIKQSLKQFKNENYSLKKQLDRIKNTPVVQVEQQQKLPPTPTDSVTRQQYNNMIRDYQNQIEIYKKQIPVNLVQCEKKNIEDESLIKQELEFRMKERYLTSQELENLKKVINQQNDLINKKDYQIQKFQDTEYVLNNEIQQLKSQNQKN